MALAATLQASGFPCATTVLGATPGCSKKPLLQAGKRAVRREGIRKGRQLSSLLTAGPACGKTTLLSQLVKLALEGPLIPILVKVQTLQKRLINYPDAFASSWNWIDAFLRLEHGAEAPYYLMLRQAMMARRALILVDGLDEAGTVRDQIETHVAEVLTPQGHVLLATSRPAGDERVDRDKIHIRALRVFSIVYDASDFWILDTRIWFRESTVFEIEI